MTDEEAIEWLKSIDKKYIHGGDEWYDEQRHEAIKTAIRALEDRPKGKWIKEKGCLLAYRCSNCKKLMYSRETESDEKFEDLSRLDSYRYCPRCGAEMRGE